MGFESDELSVQNVAPAASTRRLADAYCFNVEGAKSDPVGITGVFTVIDLSPPRPHAFVA